MEVEPRQRRADAERNRAALVAAAAELFAERGVEVGVGEIAERAGVGRGTLFRHFPSKEDLVVSVIVAEVQDRVRRGRALIDAPDPVAALFGVIDEIPRYAERDHAIVQTLDECWIHRPEMRAAHDQMLAVLEALLTRAQATGQVRDDVSAVDLLLMVKGMCESARAFRHVDPEIGLRQADLIKAAIRARGTAAPLRGTPPSRADLERVAG